MFPVEKAITVPITARLFMLVPLHLVLPILPVVLPNVNGYLIMSKTILSQGVNTDILKNNYSLHKKLNYV